MADVPGLNIASIAIKDLCKFLLHGNPELNSVENRMITEVRQYPSLNGPRDLDDNFF